MAKMSFKGLDEYARKLERMKKNTPETLGAGVYAMAEIVADEVKKNLEAIPAISDAENIRAYKNGEKSRLTVGQKKGLVESFGIAPAQNDNGYLHVKLGFDGYNEIKTKKYPKGQPNEMIARTAESGSSYMNKTPFIRPAIRAKENEAIEKCKEVIDKRIKFDFD